MTPTPLIAVEYIGYRPSFRDHLYGTGLVFTTGQVRNVPAELARKLLRHHDLFKEGTPADVEQTEPPKTEPTLDDEAVQAVEAANKAKQEEKDQESKVQDLHDTINTMDKTALEAFARENYRQELDKRLSLPKLRDQVRGFVEQYGVV